MLRNPKRKNKIFATQQMFEINNNSLLWGGNCTINPIIQKTLYQEIRNEEECIS
jgi:hypothetical protein